MFFPQLLHYYRKSKLFLCFSLFLGANVTGYKINLSIMICVLKHLKLIFIKIIFFVRIWKRQTYAQMSCVGMFFSLVYLDKVEPQFIENLLRNSLRWPIYIINSVDKTKLSGYTPYRPITTVSLGLNITFTDHLCSSFLFFSLHLISCKTITSNLNIHFNFLKNLSLRQKTLGSLYS